MVKVKNHKREGGSRLLEAVGDMKQRTDRGGRFWLLPKTRAAAVLGCPPIGTSSWRALRKYSIGLN